MRPFLAVVVVTAATLSAAACSDGLATSPSAMPTVVMSSSTDASGDGSRTSALAESILAGSAYRITAVDADAFTISGENAQGSFTAAPFDAGTAFRRAQLNFFPNDPPHLCRDRVGQYNDSTGFGDTGFLSALGALVDCNARIIVQFGNELPPNPIRILSFQPIQ